MNRKLKTGSVRRVWTLRAIAVVVSLALLAVGMPFLPGAPGVRKASATPSTPFECVYPGSDWGSSPTIHSSPNLSGGFTTDDSAYDPGISIDGRHVSYSSYSSQHVSGDTNASADVFMHDRLTRTNSRASLATGGIQPTKGSVASAVSYNGGHVAYYSSAPNFLGGDPDTAAYFFDAYQGRISVPNDALRGSTTLSVEAWFKTTSNGVIIGMSDAGYGATPTQWTPAVYVGTDGKLRGKFWGGNGAFASSGVVNDGRWHHVALTGAGSTQSMYLDGASIGTLSGAINHVSMSVNYIGMGFWTNWDGAGTGWSSFVGKIDEVAVHRTALSPARVLQHYQARTNNYAATVSADGPWGYWRLGDGYPGNTAADASGNGRHGTFGPSGVGKGEFGALTVDLNEKSDIFVRNMTSGQTVRVSETSAGGEINFDSSDPAISANGRYVSFYTDGPMEASDTNNTWDVYLRDRDTDEDLIFDEPGQVSTTRVSLSSTGSQGTSASYFAKMSPDARFIAFNSYAPFDPSDTNNNMDVYIRDRQAGTTQLLTPGISGGAGNDSSYYPTVSTDGSKVTFYSWASNLVTGDTNAKPDVFVRDRNSNTTARISLTPAGAQANDGSWYPSISANGRHVVFHSAATDLISGDTNGFQDVFSRNLATGVTERVSLTHKNEVPNGGSSTFSAGVISGDGGMVAFQSSATNMVAGTDSNGTWSDVFERDRAATSGFDLSPTLGIEPVAQSDELGLEQFHSYLPTDLGTGTAYTNLRTGNVVASFDDASIPGQGLNSVVRHVYNSQSSTTDNGVGKGWRLSVSDVEGGLEGLVGDALSADADGLEDLSGDVVSALTDLDLQAPITTTSIGKVVGSAFQVTGQLLEFTDGDGTTHRFVRELGPCGRWISPPGVSLKVREVFGANPLAGVPVAYELVRPDGVVYRAEPLQFLGPIPSVEWRVKSVTDRRGNQLTFQYERFGSILDKTRIRNILHNRTGTSVVRFDWTAGGDLDKVVALPGVSSPDPATGTIRSWERWVDFDVDAATKQLRSVTENNHPTPPGGYAASSTTSYSYDASGVLSGVTDGRGNSTGLSYTNGKLTKVTDRTSKEWLYGYSVDGSNNTNTTVTSPVGSATTFKISPKGTIGGGDERVSGRNIVSITDAGHGDPAVPVVTNYEWTANRLTKSTNGAGTESRFEYNDLGLLSKVTRAPPNAASHPEVPDAVTSEVTNSIQYRFPVDFGYAAGKCTQPPSSGPVTSEGACFTAAEMTRVIVSDTPSAQRRISDFQYDAVGNVTKAIQRASRDTSVSSDAPPAPTDRVVGFTYYNRGGLRTVDGPRTDAADVTTWGDTADPTYGGYDRTGMPTRLVDALGKTKTFAFTPYGQVGKVTDRDGRVSTSKFDEDSNLRSVTDPSGHQTTFEYNANDQRNKMTLPKGGYAEWSFDLMGRTTSVTTPGASVSHPRTMASSSYFDDGRVATQTGPLGAVISYTYWPNRLVKKVDAPAQTGGRAITDVYYDNAGRPVRSVFPVATSTGSRPELQIVYNPNGSERSRSETSTTGSMRTTRLAYNALGEPIRTDGPRSVGGVEEATSSTVDTFGQVTSSKRRKSSSSWLESTFAYDLAGNPTSTSQPSGNGNQLTSSYVYDSLNRLASQAVDPVNPGHTVDYGYDNEGNQTVRTDRVNGLAARTITTAYNPDLTVQEVVATDNGTGQTVATCNYAAGALPSSGYDADHNLLAQRTVAGIGGCAGLSTERTLSMGYDDRGWLTDLTQGIRSPENGLTYSRTQSFGYNVDGTRASFTHAGQATSYGYSPAGWQESITDWRGEQSTSSYLPSGAPTSEALGTNGPRAAYEWHPDGLPKSLTWTRVSGQIVRRHSDIAYDAGGFRTGETTEILKPADSSLTGAGASFGYDLLGRLTDWTSPFTDSDAGDRLRSVYSLDDGGNVTNESVTKTSSGASWESASFTYSSGRLTQQQESRFLFAGLPNQSTTTNFSYDGLGEETQRSTTFEPIPGLPGVPTEISNTSYDASGHAKAIDDTSVRNRDVSYVYDTGGTLLSRFDANAPADSPKATLYFRWGGREKLVEEADGTGATLLRYLTDDDGEAVAQLKFNIVAGHRDPTDNTGRWQWLLRDPNDSIATVTKDDGTVDEQSAFDPYGKPTKAGSSQQDASQKQSNLGFQGSLTDKATGNLLLASRQYDPTTARFISPDTFVAGALDLAVGSDSLTGNRYLFAAANPVAFYENGYAPAWLRSVGRFGKALLRNKLVRGIAIGVAIGVACGLTAGIGCAVAVGVGAGAVLGAANYAANAKGSRTLKGLAKATVGGAVEGAIVGASGAVIGKAVGAIKLAAVARIAARAPPTVAANRAAGLAAEASLRSLVGGEGRYFATSQGGRFVDAFSQGVAHEAKVGFVNMSPRIATQISKDAELLAGGQVRGVAWHFFESSTTGLAGASNRVLEALAKAGITVHP